MYTTRYGENIARILAAYPPGLLQVKAIEVLIGTAQQHAREKAHDDMADQVCERLHHTPAAGLKCRACYDVEKNLPMQMSIEGDIMAAMAAGVRAGSQHPGFAPEAPDPVYSVEPLSEE